MSSTHFKRTSTGPFARYCIKRAAKLMKRLHIEYGLYVRAHNDAPLHSSVRTPLRSSKEEKSHCCCDSVTVILMEILSAPSVEFRENNI